MRIVTIERTLPDGRWQLLTYDGAAPERFVSSIERLKGNLIVAFVDGLLGIADSSHETIMHDSFGWRRTPAGANAELSNSRAECRAMHAAVVARFFRRDLEVRA